jgi:hypothetical protein
MNSFNIDQEIDYRKFYDDESYLFDEVGPRFQRNGVIEASDFYMMLIWKANRAKNRHRDRLKRVSHSTFADAVTDLARSLFKADTDKERLHLLMSRWGFYLPTASAILTILYPGNFTVFDYRVAYEVKFKNLAQREFSDQLWAEYRDFCEEVRVAPPEAFGLSLRDCDRFLIGRSFRKELERDCTE